MRVFFTVNCIFVRFFPKLFVSSTYERLRILPRNKRDSEVIGCTGGVSISEGSTIYRAAQKIGTIGQWRRRLECVVQQQGGHIEH